MKFSLILALLISIAAVGWIASGQIDKIQAFREGREIEKPQAKSVADNLRAEISGDVTRLTAVRAQLFEAKTRTRIVTVRGRTEALRKVTIKAGVKGRIVELKIRQGDRVKEGSVIARIEIDDLNARLAESKALVRQRKLEYDGAKKLRTKGFKSETQIAAAAAALDAARAYVKQVQVQISKTKIRAPFDAIIDDKLVEIGEYMEPKTAILSLIDEDPFLVVAQVSEQEVGLLKTGGSGKAVIIDGTTVHGSIRFISRVANAETRTFKVELEVSNEDRQLRDGMSAELHFPIESIKAHLLSPAILTLNDEGTVGVRIVDRENIVSFVPVEVVGADSQGVWISGLPRSVKIITVGNEFVRQGDKVRVDSVQAPQS